MYDVKALELNEASVLNCASGSETGSITFRCMEVEPLVGPSQVGPQVERQVEQQVERQVERQVGPQVEPQMEPLVEPQVEPRMELQVEPQVEPRAITGVSSTTCKITQLSSTIDDFLELDLDTVSVTISLAEILAAVLGPRTGL